jgi:hypothetical protein
VELTGSNAADSYSSSNFLPLLGLNEVFMGESDPSSTSYFEVSVNGSSRQKLKSSGMVVCTGSGSSAWAYNISRVTEDQVKSILRLGGFESVSDTTTKQSMYVMLTCLFCSKLNCTCPVQYVKNTIGLFCMMLVILEWSIQ